MNRKNVNKISRKQDIRGNSTTIENENPGAFQRQRQRRQRDCCMCSELPTNLIQSTCCSNVFCTMCFREYHSSIPAAEFWYVNCPNCGRPMVEFVPPSPERPSGKKKRLKKAIANYMQRREPQAGPQEPEEAEHPWWICMRGGALFVVLVGLITGFFIWRLYSYVYDES